MSGAIYYYDGILNISKFSKTLEVRLRAVSCKFRLVNIYECFRLELAGIVLPNFEIDVTPFIAQYKYYLLIYKTNGGYRQILWESVE